MGDDSKIEWTDATFNAVWGCTEVSPGCNNCYARTLAKRYGFDVWDNGKFREFGDKHWGEPQKWNARAAKEGRRMGGWDRKGADMELWPLGLRVREFPQVTQHQQVKDG